MRLAAANAFDVGEIRLCADGAVAARAAKPPGMCAGIGLSLKAKT